MFHTACNATRLANILLETIRGGLKSFDIGVPVAPHAGRASWRERLTDVSQLRALQVNSGICHPKETMSKLSTIRKQIAALEAQAARIAKEEIDSAIGKVKSLMSEFGLTIEHLTQSVTGKAVAKKSKPAQKKAVARKTVSAAKYADPKTGKTWSGFGRAPGWIAAAKNRDAFLVAKSAPPLADAVSALGTKKAAVKKAAKVAVAPVKKTTKAVARKASPHAKKVGTSARKASSKKAVAKKGAHPSASSTIAATTAAAE